MDRGSPPRTPFFMQNSSSMWWSAGPVVDHNLCCSIATRAPIVANNISRDWLDKIGGHHLEFQCNFKFLRVCLIFPNWEDYRDKKISSNCNWRLFADLRNLNWCHQLRNQLLHKDWVLQILSCLSSSFNLITNIMYSLLTDSTSAPTSIHRTGKWGISWTLSRNGNASAKCWLFIRGTFSWGKMII